MEHDFTGVVAPDVTENEKIGPKNRADDIKNDEYDRKNKGKSASWLKLKELNDYPYNTSDCKDITGDHPAFHESDFMWYEQDTAFHRYDVVAMKAAWERGAVIGYCWHLKGPHSNSFYAMKNGQKSADYDLASEILSNPDRNTNKILDWYLDRYDKYAIPLFKEIGCPESQRSTINYKRQGNWTTSMDKTT